MTKEELTTLHAVFSLADEGCAATAQRVADWLRTPVRDVSRNVLRLSRLGLVRVHGGKLLLTFPGLAFAASMGESQASAGRDSSSEPVRSLAA